MAQFGLTQPPARLTPKKDSLQFPKWSQNSSNITFSSWNTGQGAVKEMAFALSFCSLWLNQPLEITKSMQTFVGKMPTLRIICYLTALVVYMDPREDFRVSHPCWSDKRKSQVLSLVVCVFVCVCVYVWFNIWWSFHFTYTRIPMWVLFSCPLIEVMQIESKTKMHSDPKGRKYLQPEKWHKSVWPHVH